MVHFVPITIAFICAPGVGSARINVAGAFNRAVAKAAPLMDTSEKGTKDKRLVLLAERLVNAAKRRVRQSSTETNVMEPPNSFIQQHASIVARSNATVVNTTLPLPAVFASVLGAKALASILDNEVLGLSPFKVLATFFGLLILLGFSCLSCICMRAQPICAKRSNTRQKYIVKDRVIYEWDQTPNTVTMYLQAPRNVSKHSMEVLAWPNRIQIQLKGKAPFLKEELFAVVDADACTWSITRKGELQIRLKKVEEAEWPCVLLAHQPTIKPRPASAPAEKPKQFFFM